MDERCGKQIHVVAIMFLFHAPFFFVINIKIMKTWTYLNHVLISDPQGAGCANYPSQSDVGPAAGRYGREDRFVGSQQNCVASMYNKFFVLKKALARILENM